MSPPSPPDDLKPKTSDEAPEFHTETLSPLSPLPVYPPEPSNIPVLRNQIDPVFNMTSTHIVPTNISVAVPDPALANSMLDATAPATQDSPSADSDFEDAYNEQPSTETVQGQDEKVDQEADVGDDYAMTFDSDGEENTSSQDVLQANLEKDAKPLPIAVSASDLPLSLSSDPLITVPQTGQSTQSAQSIRSSLPATIDAAAASLSEGVTQASTAPQVNSYGDIASGGVDIQQLLDNITANAEKNEITTPSTHNNPTPLPKGSSAALPAHSSLPPRPQVTQNFSDIQKYHAGPPGVSQQAVSQRPVGAPPSLIAAGAPGTSTDPRSGLPPPPTASFATQPNANPPLYNQLSRPSNHGAAGSVDVDDADDIDRRWGPDVQKQYDEFLADERMYVTEGLWDRFPLGSRLFIGNLPSEKVTKRDLFHVFHKYGRLAQVSIKQAYGFIQFHEASACREALNRERDTEVRGRKMHLEISKPQKNSRNAQANAPPLRRSRSPDQSRGIQDRAGRQGQGSRMANVDRYDGRSSNIRQDEYGRPLRIRDDYRPVRSPTPPRPVRGRDDYAPRRRGRADSFDPRDRPRSRSRSPYGNRNNARYRDRSPSPRAREAIEDMDLQIPRREPHNTPDVQIILTDQLDRGFVSWVEGEFRSRGIKTEVMFLSPRLPLQAVIRRQILEGVHAVTQLDMRSQNSNRIPLQVFDRQAGANVRFDEYQDLEPKIAAELVVRTKQTQAQIPIPQQVPQYAQPQFPPTQAYQSPAPAPAAPNLANQLGQLDNATLQKLLGSLNGQPQQPTPAAVSGNAGVSLAGLLGGLNQPQQHQGYPSQQPADPYALNGLASNPALASLLGGVASQQQQQQQVPPQQSAQQVQNIMAQLAKFRQ